MKYRKKPIEVNAIKYKPGMEDGFASIWIAPWIAKSTLSEHLKLKAIVTSHFGAKAWRSDMHHKIPYISTLEGRHYISKGDYIITGVKGERYPCKADIFALTYEPVEDEQIQAAAEPQDAL